MLDDIRCSKGLSRSGHTKKRLVRHARFEPFYELFYSLWLVTRRLLFSGDFEFHRMSIAKTLLLFCQNRFPKFLRKIHDHVEIMETRQMRTKHFMRPEEVGKIRFRVVLADIAIATFIES